MAAMELATAATAVATEVSAMAVSATEVSAMAVSAMAVLATEVSATAVPAMAATVAATTELAAATDRVGTVTALEEPRRRCSGRARRTAIPRPTVSKLVPEALTVLATRRTVEDSRRLATPEALAEVTTEEAVTMAESLAELPAGYY
uniref:Putative secreted protein n=1 Tax=Ixodes ricinus TaxID=34613 RepID=A0A6B0UV97_IXORI